jgi:hypothetical protein
MIDSLSIGQCRMDILADGAEHRAFFASKRLDRPML